MGTSSTLPYLGCKAPRLVKNFIALFAFSVFPEPDSPLITMAYFVFSSII